MDEQMIEVNLDQLSTLMTDYLLDLELIYDEYGWPGGSYEQRDILLVNWCLCQLASVDLPVWMQEKIKKEPYTWSDTIRSICAGLEIPVPEEAKKWLVRRPDKFEKQRQ